MTAKEEKALKFLRDISPQLYKHNYGDVRPWLIDCVRSVPVPLIRKETIPRMSSNGWYSDPSILYRACENTVFLKTRYTNALPWKTVDRISHAPLVKEKEIIKDYGRANLPGQARFYCSNFYPTACVECLTQGFTINESESKTVTSGAWRVAAPLVLAQIAFSPKKLLEIRHLNPDLYEERLAFTKDWYEHTTKDFEDNPLEGLSLEYTVKLLEFFSDEFAKTDIASDRDYILSNFYAESVFEQTYLADGTPIDGMIYPSVKYSYQEFNVVLHPRAMQKLTFTGATLVWVTHDGRTKQTQFTPLERCSSDAEGNLKWNLFKY